MTSERGGPQQHKSTDEEKHRCFCGVQLVAASCPDWYCATVLEPGDFYLRGRHGASTSTHGDDPRLPFAPVRGC
ncbi:hypothetical protein WH47_04693 [Habropoda laboriosa]|uniref:Uncharacterized protein n=1 Tax=Habropoda laboriosa TaxID=597456 RepID=A0A0L7R2P3_9HYME|nr:hypothetical protein WH47_04693 [Habropoda laboriosa]